MKFHDQKALNDKRVYIAELESEFRRWKSYFQECADYILPRRYGWLDQKVQQGEKRIKPSTKIMDPTATLAARILANGLMNGITSPARPWFRARLHGYERDSQIPQSVLEWLDEATRRVYAVLATSNFYTAQALQYLELPVFGTAAMIVYEDFDEVIRCYPVPMGEYRLGQNARREIVTLTRRMQMTVKQIVDTFGIENVSTEVRNAYGNGGGNLLRKFSIVHLIEPNEDDAFRINPKFAYREIYMEEGRKDSMILRLKGFHEKPFAVARWELMGDDTYGTGPAVDALPDIKQLQQETIRKAQGIDNLARPPIVVSSNLAGNQRATLPGGLSFISPEESFFAQPLYTTSPPLGEMSKDIQDIQIRIREAFYNHLFRNVSQLETVRSAAEVYQRKSEDMLLLGGILERYQNESLGPVLDRVFGIMHRKGLFPEIPEGFGFEDLRIEYISVLAEAQRASATGSIERLWATVGQLSAVSPDVLDLVDNDTLFRTYAEMLNVPYKGLKDPKEVEEARAQREQQLQAQQAALVGETLTGAAKNLSETDVGGGQNALQQMLGG